MQTSFRIAANGPGFYEFTGEVEAWTAGQSDGLTSLFVRHTSCSLLVQENAEPSVQEDLHGFLARRVPSGDAPSKRWLTHTLEGADVMPARIRAMILQGNL